MVSALRGSEAVGVQLRDDEGLPRVGTARKGKWMDWYIFSEIDPQH